jgi:hypothetical protein
MAVPVLAAAVILAILANVIVYSIVTGPLGEPMVMCSYCALTRPVLEAMSVVDPIIFSTIFGIGAVVVYTIVSSFSVRPLRVFALTASVVLLGSLALPMSMPSPPVELSAKLALVAMHIVGYIVILGTLWIGHRRGWLTSRNGGNPGGRS